MSINAAPFISTVPLSHSNRPYREPRLQELPEGNNEQIERLRWRIKSANLKLIFPDGQD